jgi:hypothetical protein
VTFIRDMVKVRGLVALSFVAGGVASAQPKTPVPPLVGATETVKLVPPTGFVDDGVALDAQRLAYVASNAEGHAELHVVTLAPRQDQTYDLVAVTTHPIALQLVGNRVLVIGAGEEDKQVAALVDLGAAGKPGSVVYKVGPATHITPITRDGKPRLAVHKIASIKDGTRHDVEILALETGKRIAAGSLDLDDKNANKAKDLRINHWSDGWTRAYGLKGGEWDPKENQRTPDVEAALDIVTGKIEKQKIGDLFEQRKRFQALADSGGTIDFLRMTWDNSAIQLWHTGKAKQLELDQAIAQYDPKSLQGTVAADGSAWFALAVDPVNPEAVARKKADPEYLDVFHAGADGKAVRKARVLVPAANTKYRIGFAADKFWLVERSPSFDRGGKNVAVYTLQ